MDALRCRRDGGLAIAELVICLPLLLAVFSAVVSYGRLRHLQTSLDVAAYTGAAMAAHGGAAAQTAHDYMEAEGFVTKDHLTVVEGFVWGVPGATACRVKVSLSYKSRLWGFLALGKDDSVVSATHSWYVPMQAGDLKRVLNKETGYDDAPPVPAG
jgi:uncharacterized membrane protein